MTHGEVVI